MSASPDPPSLPDAWRTAFGRLVAEAEAEQPTHDGGCWSVRFDWVTAPTEHVRALLPGRFERVAEHWEDMFDDSGESVNYESESAVYACDEQRAIFQYADHWQAGLGGSVTVFPDDATYRAACASAIASCNDDDELEPEDVELELEEEQACPAAPRPMTAEDRAVLGRYLRMLLGDLDRPSTSDELRGHLVDPACSLLASGPLDERTLTDVLMVLRRAIDRGDMRTLDLVWALPRRLEDGRDTDSAVLRLGKYALERGSWAALSRVAARVRKRDIEGWPRRDRAVRVFEAADSAVAASFDDEPVEIGLRRLLMMFDASERHEETGSIMLHPVGSEQHARAFGQVMGWMMAEDDHEGVFYAVAGSDPARVPLEPVCVQRAVTFGVAQRRRRVVFVIESLAVAAAEQEPEPGYAPWLRSYIVEKLEDLLSLRPPEYVLQSYADFTGSPRVRETVRRVATEGYLETVTERPAPTETTR